MSDEASRLKLIVAYDGTFFAGWQSQANRNTIQDHLERAFKRITAKNIRVHGAGRTDAGVHALGQCAHVDVTNKNLSSATWTKALNANLPATIRVLRCSFISRNFHARFSAKRKLYRYRIWNGEILLPIELNRAWHFSRPLDLELLKAAATCFVGKHDFAAFSANRGKVEKSTVRTIYDTRVCRKGHAISIEFEADGFLYKMVRLMTGAIVRCATGKTQIGELRSAFKAHSTIAGRLVAPAEGLFLVTVSY